MPARALRLIACGGVLVAALYLPAWPLTAHAQQTATTTSLQASLQPALDRYCITCHNARLKTAGLMLDRLDLAAVGRDAETWEKVARKLRTH
jgi:mono/diheme cytochrome c family protein